MLGASIGFRLLIAHLCSARDAVLASAYPRGSSCGAKHRLWQRDMRHCTSVCGHTRRGGGLGGPVGFRQDLAQRRKVGENLHPQA